MAAIPSPPTITVGQKVTAAYLNASIRDAVNFLTAQPLCVVTSSVVQNLTTSTQTPLTFDTEATDSDAMHSTVSATSRLTAITPGWYLLTGTVTFAANATGDRFVSFLINGATELARVDQMTVTTASRGPSLTTSTVLFLNAGDYVELTAWQNSGATLATALGGGGSRLSALWVHS